MEENNTNNNDSLSINDNDKEYREKCLKLLEDLIDKSKDVFDRLKDK